MPLGQFDRSSRSDPPVHDKVRSSQSLGLATRSLILQRISSFGSSDSKAATNSTGEFDPGSERTLAARLTHASRTRKGFGPGKVAHG